ncbi:hypothetical protein [Sporosarcina limicola]|uniref:Chemotaxis protein histidine kinase CheA n=1 Tax=Sporosarcina limicola TaxID=34101 RepID=A0A927MPU8_9BACL|nr:hypothetical protein [Sporosarcina limicola]MBE1556782.1 chemotaxis protein histidine kinase CheA [Sporosarcina limicola]
MESEFNGFKAQVSNLKEAMETMDGKQSTQVEEYEQQIKNFSVQIDSFNHTVEELNQNISLIINKFKSSNSEPVIEEINTSVDFQDSSNPENKNKKNEVNLIIEETTYAKDQTAISSIQKNNLPPSFKQLQRASSIQEVPSHVTPTESIDFQKQYQEKDQHFNKQSFPSSSINPNQIYNGLFRNVNTQSIINTNNIAKKQATPIKINPTRSFILTDSEPETIEIVTEKFDNLHDAAPIEKIIDISKEEIDMLEISNETEQKEKNGREALSFFKFFRKRN